MKVTFPTSPLSLAQSEPAEFADLITTDPVHEFEGAWWFYDETWGDRRGPYATQAEAHAALSYYCDNGLGR